MDKRRTVFDKLVKIFEQLFDIDLEKLEGEFYEKSLLGKEFCLSATDLLCLYMEVEKQFSVSIPQEEVAKGKFNSINNITDIITENLPA